MKDFEPAGAILRFALANFLLLGIDSAIPIALAQAPPEMVVETAAGQLTGLPIHWSSRQAVLLQADGQMEILDTRQMLSHQVTRNGFVPQTLAEARVLLQAELGGNFETLVAGPYVIAAPNGHVGRWRDRFQVLLAGYMRYFELRDGWSLRSPDFPLRVIVFPDRQSFVAYAAAQGVAVPASAIGSYFPRSNRCILYELSHSNSIDWSETEATVVHEAVHQLAYNTGVHERLFSNPLWCVEGLAAMFEVPAVYDLRTNRSTIQLRIHPNHVRRLQPLLADATLLEAGVSSLIASDDLFEADPSLAYALSWALTFYLSERMPREYAKLLERQTKHGFGQYTAGQRIADFRRAVGVSPASLAIGMQRLLAN